MKVVFFGTPEFAMPVLEALKEGGYDVFHFKSKNLKDEEVFEEFKNLNPNICIVAAYGKIIPKRYLDVPKYGFLNVHPSLLPKYRGPSPVQTAILNGDTETGVTIMVVDEEMDHGPLLAKREFLISNPEGQANGAGFQFSNHDELAKELFELGAELLIEILPKYISGKLKPMPQDHDQAIYTKMFTRKDGHINWSDSPEKIYNQIRALNPEPGTWTMWKNKILNIKAASVKTLASPKPPAKRGSASQGKPTLEIEIIQMEGKKEMPFKEFLNGHPGFDISQLN